jgi:hypothetical protein
MTSKRWPIRKEKGKSMSSLSSTLTGFARNYGVTSKKRAARSKQSLQVHASTLWTLQSTGGVSKATLDLTDAIGRKRVCSIGAKVRCMNHVVSFRKRETWYVKMIAGLLEE